MRHPFDGIIAPSPAVVPLGDPRPTRRSILARSLAAACGVAAALLGREATAQSYLGRRPRRPTTFALGEEGGGPARPPYPGDGRFTTYAFGEEGGGPVPPPYPGSGRFTTYALGEEGGATTYALGEEGGAPPTTTTQALGEEGGATSLALGEEGGAPPWQRNGRNAYRPRAKDMPDHLPGADESSACLHAAVWSVGYAADVERGALVWPVTGSDGEKLMSRESPPGHTHSSR